MATQVVDRAYLNIDGVEFDARSIDWTASLDGADTSKTMNRRNRAKSHKAGVPTFELSAEIPRPEDDHEIDFMSMMLGRVYFTTIIEYQDGTSDQFYDCWITSINHAPSSGDEVVTKLEIRALDYGKN